MVARNFIALVSIILCVFQDIHNSNIFVYLTVEITQELESLFCQKSFKGYWNKNIC